MSARLVKALVVAALAGTAAGCAALGGPKHRPALFQLLPEEAHLPDGMAVDKEGDIILACPNYNDPKFPAILVKIDKAGKLSTWCDTLPVAPTSKRCGPMGIAFGPDGHLYVADLQYFFDKKYASRLLRVNVKDGKPAGVDVIVEGFLLSNAVVWKGNDCYVSETFFDLPDDPNKSGVFRFTLDELTKGGIKLQPFGKDPHLIATFTTVPNARKDNAGADGLAFGNDGNLYCSLFGDGSVHKLTLDEKGNVKSNEADAWAPKPATRPEPSPWQPEKPRTPEPSDVWAPKPQGGMSNTAKISGLIAVFVMLIAGAVVAVVLALNAMNKKPQDAGQEPPKVRTSAVVSPKVATATPGVVPKEPKAVEPPVEPKVVEPKAVEPPVEPKVVAPKVVEPPVEPEEPKAVEPKVVAPKVVEPKVVEPPVEPKVVEPKVVEPPVEPKVVEPKVVEPKVVEPKVVEPPVEPKVVEPKAVEPKVVEPPVEPKVVEPKGEEPLAAMDEASAYVAAQDAMAKRDWARVAAAYMRAIELNPNSAAYWNGMGKALLQQGKPGEAVGAFRQAAELNKRDGWSHANLASALLAQGKRDDALAAARDAMRLGCRDHPVYKELGLDQPEK